MVPCVQGYRKMFTFSSYTVGAPYQRKIPVPLQECKVQGLRECVYNTPLLIFMHDVINPTQNEPMGPRPPSLEVAAPIASF